MRRVFVVVLGLCMWCGAAAFAGDEPETIGGHDLAWWSSQAQAHEREVEQREKEVADCEEHEAPPSYDAIPGQIVRGRRGQMYSRELLHCDEEREALDAARAELDEFEDLARRLGVPPGWLR